MIKVIKGCFFLLVFVIFTGSGCIEIFPHSPIIPLPHPKFPIELVANTPAVATVSASDLAVVSSTVAKLQPYITHQQLNGWKMLSFALPGVPLVTKTTSEFRSNTFYVYNFTADRLRMVGKNTASGYAAEHGTSGPLESVDSLYTAYIDQNNFLYIISNGTLEKRLIYQGNKNWYLFITAWSLDSKRLIFAIAPPDELGGISDSGVSYMIFNTKDGTILTFPADMGLTVGQFVDNNNVIVRVEGERKFITTVLDINTLQLNHQLYERKFGFINTITEQNNSYVAANGSLSRDGYKFAYGIGKYGLDQGYANPPPGLPKESQSMIVYGDVIKKKAIILAKGKWAQYQLPIISPAGGKVAYPEQDTQTLSMSSFWVYNTITGEYRLHKFEQDTRLLKWFDENRLLFSLSMSDSAGRYFISAYKILDIADDSIKNVWVASDSSDRNKDR